MARIRKMVICPKCGSITQEDTITEEDLIATTEKRFESTNLTPIQCARTHKGTDLLLTHYLCKISMRDQYTAHDDVEDYHVTGICNGVLRVAKSVLQLLIHIAFHHRTSYRTVHDFDLLECAWQYMCEYTRNKANIQNHSAMIFSSQSNIFVAFGCFYPAGISVTTV